MKSKKNFSLNYIYHYKKDIFLALLSALFLILLTYRIHFMAYFAIAPLLIIIYRRKFISSIIFGTITGLVSSLLMFTWVYTYKPYIYILIIIVWTAFFTAFTALTHFLYHRIKYVSLFVAPAVWLWLMLILDITKYGSYVFEFSMYNSLTTPLIWLIGGRGVTFVVIALSSAIAEFAVKQTKKKALVIIVIIIILFSCYAYSSVSEADGEPFRVVLVQGNFEKTWEWRQDNVLEIFDTYKSLSEGKIKDGLIVWPEYALPMDIVFYYPLLFEKVKAFVKENEDYLITGSLIYDKETGEHYDSALIFNPDGEFIDYYNSIYPAFYNEHTLKGDEEIKLFTIEEKKVGIMICAEETDSRIARAQTKQGAQFLVSLSNNQNFNRGIYLSDLYSKLRAAENYKYFVRATNTGVTQVINPYGKTYKIEGNKRKVLIEDIRLNEHKTPYNIYGDIPLYMATLLLIIFLRKRRGK